MEVTRHYASDLSDRQWQIIRQLLPARSHRGRRPICRRCVVNAILYVEMEKTMHSGGFEHADLVQMEEHVLTVEDTKTMGGRIYKKHRIYEKSI